GVQRLRLLRVQPPAQRPSSVPVSWFEDTEARLVQTGLPRVIVPDKPTQVVENAPIRLAQQWDAAVAWLSPELEAPMLVTGFELKEQRYQASEGCAMIDVFGGLSGSTLFHVARLTPRSPDQSNETHEWTGRVIADRIVIAVTKPRGKYGARLGM